MNGPQLMLASAPIVEAVVDIDCDMAAVTDVEALDAAAFAALESEYPKKRRRMLSEHQISALPDQPPTVTSSQGLQALQYLSVDEKQLVQFRTSGFSFNRLAPYTSLDDYIAEIERAWQIFVAIAKPVVCRTVRLRYINRILLPIEDDRVDLDVYLKLGPKLPDEASLSFVGFFNQHSVAERATDNQANIVFATQVPTPGLEAGRLPIIFEIEAFRTVSCDPDDWKAISGTIGSLRDLKNRIFKNSLTDKCLNLFRS